MIYRGRVRYFALAAIALVTVACATPQLAVTGSEPLASAPVPPTATVPPLSPTSVPPSTLPDPTLPPIIEPELTAQIPISETVDVGEAKPAADADAVLSASIRDLETWWGEIYPDLYDDEYEQLEGAIYAGYPDRTSEIPGCGTSEPTDPADLYFYVAFYCEFGDFIAYDASDESLLTLLATEYGDAVMGVVMAHEWGHAIQARIGAFDELLPTIVTEQQADCFSGAWVGRVFRGESDLIRLGDRDVRTSLIAMLEVRDPVGTDQFDAGGHGSAFDRVGAFQEGFALGPQRCVPMLDDPLPLMPNQFQGATDAARGGNAPYTCTELPADERDVCTPAPRFLGDDLNHFWETTLGEFPTLIARPVVSIDDDTTCIEPIRVDDNVALCPSNRTVIYNEPEVLDLYREFGDFTLGYLYGITWAELAIREMELDVAGEPRALLRDCFVGAWVANITPNAQGQTPRSGDRDGDGIDDSVQSSPGDLDEAIQMAILIGDEGVNINDVGSPFEKIDWFRNGVLANVDTCLARANLP